MGDEREYIFEGSAARPRIPSHLRQRRTIAAALAIALISTALIFGQKPGHKPARVVAAPSVTATPWPSPTPTSIGKRLTGVGPFAIVQIGTSGAPFIAVDLGAAGFPRINLGIPDGQSAYEIAHSVQMWGRAVPIDINVLGPGDSSEGTTSYWFLSKGGGFDDKPVSVPGQPYRTLASPDGRSVIAINPVPGEGLHSDIFLVSADGSPPKKLARVLSGGSKDEDGALTPLVWLPDGWLAMSICACEASPRRWYSISTKGLVKPAGWLGVPTDITPGVSTDGRYISLFDVPTRDCGIQQVCAAGPSRILLIDTVTRRIRVLGRYRNDLGGQTTLSSDGSLIASTLPGTRSIQVFDAKSGSVVSTFGYPGYVIWPSAFINNSTLLLTGTKESGRGDDLFLARLEFGRVRVTRVIRDILPLVGWTR